MFGEAKENLENYNLKLILTYTLNRLLSFLLFIKNNKLNFIVFVNSNGFYKKDHLIQLEYVRK